MSRRLWLMVIPSLAGGLTGAWLLKLTPGSVFDRLVPFLILFATLLFMAQDPVQRLLGTGEAAKHQSNAWFAGGMFFQLLVGLYGGYFGAGIGILMLAALSIMGLTDIHEMNSLKVVLGGSVNGIAAVYFIVTGMVYWPYVLIMAVAAILGGYLAAGVARRLGKVFVRRVVIGVGLIMAVSLFVKH